MKQSNIEEQLYEEIVQEGTSFGLPGYNNSHYFLLPLFAVKTPLIYPKFYVGSFISDNERRSEIENTLLIMFRFKNFEQKEVKTITESMENKRGYMYSYYAGHNEGELICYVFKAWDDIVDSYKLLIEGRYSELPISYLNRVLNYPFKPDTKNRIKAICRKEKWHMDEIEKLSSEKVDVNLEMWTEFEPSLEVFRYEEKQGRH